VSHMKTPEMRNAEMPLKMGTGSWPWVTLRVEPEEREASL
jgi:hypothetical protein